MIDKNKIKSAAQGYCDATYGCGDMRFEPQSPTKEVLAKYNITEEEYNKICDELEDKLFVGRCGWCV